MTRWTAEPKSNGDDHALTDDEDGKRYSSEPRPTEGEHRDDPGEKKREPTTRPNDKPRLRVEVPGDRLLDGDH